MVELNIADLSASGGRLEQVHAEEKEDDDLTARIGQTLSARMNQVLAQEADEQIKTETERSGEDTAEIEVEKDTNIFTVIYETIRVNHLEFGYAKSPDFFHK